MAKRMFKMIRVAVASGTMTAAGITPTISAAGVACDITSYQVEVYDHGGAYVHGLLDGRNVSWIVICGTAADCNDRATDRRVALALTGQASGKPLIAYFDSLNTCADFQPYQRVTGLKLRS